MKEEERGSVAKAEQVLRDCLTKVPSVRIEPAMTDQSLGTIGPDMMITVYLPEGEKVLAVEVTNSGQPKVAREAVNRLRRYQESDPDIYGVFVAPYISPATAAICMEEGIGYADLAGNCHFSLQSVYVERTGHPNPFPDRRDLRSLFSPKATRILRVLLENPQRDWKTQALADEAEVSLGQVAKVKKLLVEREWVRVGPGGLSLKAPEQLLAEWARNYTYRKNVARDYYSLKPIAEVETQLAQVCQDEAIYCALTAFSGASRLVAAVRYQRAFAYVSAKEEQIRGLLRLKAVSSGANVTLLIPYDERVFYGTREMNGVPVASPIQIYLDLLRLKGRGEEAAQTLLEEVIRPTW